MFSEERQPGQFAPGGGDERFTRFNSPLASVGCAGVIPAQCFKPRAQASHVDDISLTREWPGRNGPCPTALATLAEEKSNQRGQGNQAQNVSSMVPLA